MFRQSEFLDDLNTALHGMKADGCELILLQAGGDIQAGGDMHIDDPLGGAATTEELRERDQFVFETCHDNGMACCWNFAGGYQVEADGSIPVVLEIHRNTAREAIRVLSMRER